MAGPRAVLLDVGGVLLLPSPDQVRPALRGAVPSVATLDRAHYRALAVASRTTGPDWDRYFHTYARTAGVPRSALPGAVTALREVFGHVVWTRVVPGAAALLGRLRAGPLRIGLVSNSDGTVAERLRELSVCQVGSGPGVRVDAILDSGLVGLEKPDPRIFALALDTLGVGPQEAVHVGDSVHADVDGARAAGVRALHFVPYGDCRPAIGSHEHLGRLDDLAAILAGDRPRG